MRNKSFSVAYGWMGLIFLQYFARSQFPRRCTDETSLVSCRCCPLGSDGTPCGVLSRRGVCTNILPGLADATIERSLPLLLDDRAWWPRAFYDLACFCFDNYDGVDCSECQPGYEGDDCSTKSPLKVRKNIRLLSPEELSTFILIFHSSKLTTSFNYVLLTTSYDRILEGETPQFVDASIYDVFVWMHYYVTRNNQVFKEDDLNGLTEMYTRTNQEMRMQIAKDLLRDSGIDDRIVDNADYAHEGSSFPLWHRLFLLKFEKEVGIYVANDINFALPYWDWRDKIECDVCNDFMVGAIGSPTANSLLLSPGSVFSQWTTICTKKDEYLKNKQQCGAVMENENLERNPGVFDINKISGLPRSLEVFNIFTHTTFYDTPPYNKKSSLSFRNLLEGFADPVSGIFDGRNRSYMHNAVHIWMNGTMSGVDQSANDPIFYLHHAFIDNLFELWLQKDQNLVYDGFFQSVNGPNVGHRIIDYMVPFFPLVQNWKGFTDTESLGYVYDYMQQSDSDLSGGAIAGIVVGSVVFLVLFGILVFCIHTKCRN